MLLRIQTVGHFLSRLRLQETRQHINDNFDHTNGAPIVSASAFFPAHIVYKMLLQVRR
jgi:hypothetical protein